MDQFSLQYVTANILCAERASHFAPSRQLIIFLAWVEY